MSCFNPQIGVGAFGVVHRAVAVGIRDGEDQVVLIMMMMAAVVMMAASMMAEVMIVWIFSDGGGSQVCEAICRKRSAEGGMW